MDRASEASKLGDKTRELEFFPPETYVYHVLVLERAAKKFEHVVIKALQKASSEQKRQNRSPKPCYRDEKLMNSDGKLGRAWEDFF